MTNTERAERRGRPATGRTPGRHVRVGPVWDEVATLAAIVTGENMPAVLARLLAVEADRLRGAVERSQGQGQL